jgi:hypothetical protein
MSKQTPWGPAQHQKQVAPGITVFETAGHGGYFVSLEKRLRMPSDILAVQRDGWYEEDCDWALVCLAFPECFPPEDYKFAVDTCNSYYPNVVTPERQAKADAWTSANEDKYAQGSAGTGPNGTWQVSAYNVANPALNISKTFLGIPVLPAVFTREQFENAPMFKG